MQEKNQFSSNDKRPNCKSQTFYFQTITLTWYKQGRVRELTSKTILGLLKVSVQNKHFDIAKINYMLTIYGYYLQHYNQCQYSQPVKTALDQPYSGLSNSVHNPFIQP